MAQASTHPEQDLRDARVGRLRLRAQGRFALAVGLVSTGLLLWLRAGFATPPVTIAAGPLPLTVAMIIALTYATVGLLLSLHRPEVRIGALAAWIGIAIAGLTAAWGFLIQAGGPTAVGAALAPYVAIGTAVVVTPIIPALLVVMGLLFPNDRLLSARWRQVVWLAAVGAIAAAVGRLLRAGPVTFVGSYDDPFGVEGLGSIPSWIQISGFAMLGLAALFTGACLIRRYALSDDPERAQLRVFMAVTIAQAMAFVLFVGLFIFPDVNSGLRDGIVVLNLLVFAAGPMAIALAITRYRLYEIDHLVGRTFVFGALTAILAGLYAASIRLFTALFTAITGEQSDAALVITTLILATTFTPIKTRLEAFVDRWSRERQPSGPGAAAPTAGASLDPFADPAFVAALDAHIRAVREHETDPRP